MDLSSIIKTKKEQVEIVSAIDNIINSLYNIKNNPTQKIQELFPYEKKEALLILVQKSNVNLNDTLIAQEFFKKLKEEILALPEVSITLAFEPKQDTVDLISSWVSTNTKTHSILEITINQDIIGGAIISYNGKYKDLSVKKLLTEQFQPIN